MSRENAAEKARRLLVEGRLRVRQYDDASGAVWADVRGDSGRVYSVTHRAGVWRCDCDARGVSCSHVKATQLVVVVNPIGLVAS